MSLNLTIEVPLAINAICGISFEDQEGIYIFQAEDAAQACLDNVRELKERTHNCKQLQDMSDHFGISKVVFSALEGYISVDSLDDRMTYHMNEYGDEVLNEGFIPSRKVVENDDTYITSSEEEILYVGEIKKIVKVRSNPSKIVKDRTDIISSFMTQEQVIDDNPLMFYKDLSRMLNDKTTGFKNLGYYYCFKDNLDREEPKVKESRSVPIIMKDSNNKITIFSNFSKASKHVDVPVKSVMKGIREDGLLVVEDKVLTELYLEID